MRLGRGFPARPQPRHPLLWVASGPGGVVHDAEAALQAVATTTIDGSLVAGGDASLVGVATVSAEGSVQLLAESSLQGVASLASDGSVDLLGESALQGVGSLGADGFLELGGEASLMGVATLTADGDVVTPIVHDAEAILLGVAHMGFAPDVVSRHVPWHRSGGGSFYPAPNRRRVRGPKGEEVAGGRVVSEHR